MFCSLPSIIAFRTFAFLPSSPPSVVGPAQLSLGAPRALILTLAEPKSAVRVRPAVLARPPPFEAEVAKSLSSSPFLPSFRRKATRTKPPHTTGAGKTVKRVAYLNDTGLPAYSDRVGTVIKCHCKRVSLYPMIFTIRRSQNLSL